MISRFQGVPAGTMIDGWRVVSSLGAGGFGAVQKVEKNGRLHALKIALLPEGTPDEKKTHARTLRELLCLLLLNHPNIVRVVAHGRWPDETGGHLYLVLEFIEGWTVAEWLVRTHPTPREIIRVFEKIAAAVAYMHSRGVFHRDLKLINVLVRKSDGEPVIIDFGAAAFAQAPELTDAGLPPGTDRYRAPEANRWWFANRKKSKARYDFRVTDELFAFGVMLYDALTDPRPTEERDRSAVNHVLAPARDPQALNPRLPDALASLVRRLLARNPAERPEDFEAVRRELEELLGHQGAEYRAPAHSPSAQVAEPSEGSLGSPPPDDSSVKVARWRSRRRIMVGGAVGAAVLMAAAGTYALGRGFAEPSPDTARQQGGSPPPTPPASVPAAAPPTPPTATDTGPTVAAASQKEGSNLKTQKSPAASATPEQVKKPRFANEAQFLAWCRSAAIIGTLAAANAGCPGAQVRPEPGDCPADAVKAMKGHDLEDESVVRISFGGVAEGKNWPPLKSGKVEAVVFVDPKESLAGGADLPHGTRLFGTLWTLPDKEHPERAALRFERVQLPNGTEFPVCMVSEEDGFVGVRERRPSGAIIPFGGKHFAFFVYRWP